MICRVCKIDQAPCEFESTVKRQGLPIVTKSCRGCRDIHNDIYGAERIRDRQRVDLTVANELTRLINWPVVTS